MLPGTSVSVRPLTPDLPPCVMPLSSSNSSSSNTLRSLLWQWMMDTAAAAAQSNEPLRLRCDKHIHRQIYASGCKHTLHVHSVKLIDRRYVRINSQTDSLSLDLRLPAETRWPSWTLINPQEIHPARSPGRPRFKSVIFRLNGMWPWRLCLCL